VSSSLQKPADTRVGLAYAPGMLELARARPELVDYIEVPFEQLRHAPKLAEELSGIDVVLHCASMSIAGFVAPDEATLRAIAFTAARTRTPWIGEHLAFMLADSLPTGHDTKGKATVLSYTVCPQLSEATVERVALNLEVVAQAMPVPIILENSPQYFHVPGSDLTMVDFVGRVASRCNVGLLLDLSHFMITSMNMGTDACSDLQRFPLDKVVEIHLSGFARQSGIVWDDHAAPVSEETFHLLSAVLDRARPRAITFEYNWAGGVPGALVESQLHRVRRMIG